VLLTNADLDHLLGLFSLREGSILDIYASEAVRMIAASSLGMATVLDTFCGGRWHEPSTSGFAPLRYGSESTPHLRYRAIQLAGEAPPFARKGESNTRGTHSVAYQFLDTRTQRRLLVAPDVAAVNPELLEALATSEAILFDGTFWSSEELLKVKANAQEAGAMGHVTIKDCSLALLAKMPAPKKVYIHINNTNPILAAQSPERAAVEAAGLTVGWDGLEFEL
jgi:pyrroloquinoline quinone biosynthesis protein B